MKAAEQAPRNTWCFAPFIQECVSMAMLINAHGTTILTNRELSEHVAKRITRTTKVERLSNILVSIIFLLPSLLYHQILCNCFMQCNFPLFLFPGAYFAVELERLWYTYHNLR